MSVFNFSLGAIGFFAFFCTLLWASHKQYLLGHDNFFFRHRTDEEKRIREAQIRILEQQAGIHHVPKPKETSSKIQHGSAY